VFADSAFAAAALDAELARNRALDPRERALATELVYGVLRLEGALEARLRRFAPKRIKDPTTRIQLLIAAYQMLVLTRIPPFAAVDAAVGAVRSARGAKLAGFANAVLRKLATATEPFVVERALVESAPPWLFQRLREVVGDAEALALLGAGAADGARGGAVRLVGDPPDWLASAEVGRISPRARRPPRAGDLRVQPGYAEGAFVIQDEGSQVIGLLLGVREGDRVLDACAGRGQKTSLFSQQAGAHGQVWATDLHPAKLEALGRELTRLRLPAAECRGVDWTIGTADLPDDFDRVLVDAPCSGTGTLWHRPEIARRLGPDDPARLSDLATTILRSAATRARPGGRVVFAVCSVLPEEGEGVVTRVLDLLEPTPFDAPELSAWLDPEATSLRLLPGKHGSDGYFVASFRRR
jgi:16S rRNA (cytosine967-C5)-methyltransferase